MSEIERAIETLEKQDFSFLHVRLKDGEVYPLDDAVKIALTLCRAELEREKNPLTCDGCKDYERRFSMARPCVSCIRSVDKDRYEPKGEKA